MDRLYLELLILLAEQMQGKQMVTFELVCKTWLHASRCRSVLISSNLPTLDILAQYPMVRNYIGRLNLRSTDNLLALKFTPLFCQGCIQPWVDLVIARPKIHTQFFAYSGDHVSLIDVHDDRLSVYGVFDDINYTFIDQIRAKRPIIVTLNLTLGIFPLSHPPVVIDVLNVDRLTDELSIHVVCLICRWITVRHCKIRIPSSEATVYNEIIASKQLATTFTFELISQPSQT